LHLFSEKESVWSIFFVNILKMSSFCSRLKSVQDSEEFIIHHIVYVVIFRGILHANQAPMKTSILFSTIITSITKSDRYISQSEKNRRHLMCKYSYKIQMYLRVISHDYGRTHHDYGRTHIQKIVISTPGDCWFIQWNRSRA
jgi:hypothetical protein